MGDYPVESKYYGTSLNTKIDDVLANFPIPTVENMTTNIAVINKQGISNIASNGGLSSSVLTISQKCRITEVKIGIKVTATQGASVIPVIVVDGVEVAFGQDDANIGRALFEQGYGDEAGTIAGKFIVSRSLINCRASFALKFKNCHNTSAESIEVYGVVVYATEVA